MNCITCDADLSKGGPTWVGTRGYCSAACYLLRPKVRVQECKFCHTRIDYPGMGRRSMVCCQALPCRRAHSQERDARRRDRLAAQGLKRVWGQVVPRVATDTDLPAAEIERRLEALSAKRRATRTWLRIQDPWAQRPGSALHHSAVVTHGVDVEGAML